MAYFPRVADQATRILSGLKPTPSFLCRVGFHEWTRWEVLEQRRYNDTKALYEELRRECKWCAHPHLRLVDCKRKHW